MLKTPTIVCVFEVSAAATQSLLLAAKLAGDMGGKLVLLHPVHFHNWSIYSIMTYSPKREAADSAERAELFVREIMKHTPEVKWQLKVEAGEPAGIIEAVAEETGADLVLSARRRGRLEVLKSFSKAEPAVDVLEMPDPHPPLRHNAGGTSHQQAAII